MTAPSDHVLDVVQALPGTALPAYVYDLDVLSRHVSAVRAALPEQVELYYAAKANPDPRILTAVRPYVDGYEVSSGGELAHVADTVPGDAVAFGGPGKTRDEVIEALRRAVQIFHVESLHELHMLDLLAAQHAPGRTVPILLRLNIPVADGTLDEGNLAMGGSATPFGMDPCDADRAMGALVAGQFTHLDVRGVHAHLASGLDASAQLAVAASVVSWAVDLAARHRCSFTQVTVGGGMVVDYRRPDSVFDWAAYGEGMRALAEQHPQLRLRIEPGRSLTAGCGYYVTEVLDVKHSHGEDFAVVRGGTHHLRTPATKGHDQPCVVLPVEDWPYPWPRSVSTMESCTVVGQLCTPKDVLARGVVVPAGGLRAGDRVVFSHAGAYAWNISHHDFLMHPAPTFHYLDQRATG
ncbi:2-[(L-alanin-3-ylcarbamoyl)methyl]-2-hydroxybutanedioate decarboxylase [Austwickia sp. TVS 96-490-7B]|uniref:type III PLP-dependent enzyme n=1 Tax=Austwickia sp. TVS 96-490-7B TaxID=2830843 RepID=UPI001C55CCF8|nr:type III PLP-dependent enzyme [Austwickia sp. TVS 96-490-7B]MBW3086821.1 2-[(L-alanin-3-ylcarbamoyl)methyl]-2-hydroxybutanedioate decarboxylase [Austwickia sp. TVS 96-490-7B]